jgi:hypothetical protein
VGAELDEARSDDRRNFAMVYGSAFIAAQAEADALDKENQEKGRVQAKNQAQANLVAKYQQNKTDAEADLAKWRKDTADRLAELRVMSQNIFETRKKLRDANRDNAEMEQRIRELEDKLKYPSKGTGGPSLP